MTRSKNHKSDEDQRGLIRSLQKQIRKQEKEIKYLKKQLLYQSGPTPEEIEEEKGKICPDCSKGQLREIIILQRSIWTCDYCHYRTKARKL